MLHSKFLLPVLHLISDKPYLSSPVTSENSKRSVLCVCLWCRARRTSPPQDELSPGRRPPLPFSCSITMAALCALGWRARWSCYTMTSTTIPHWRAHILPPLPIQEPSLFIALFSFQHMTFALGLSKVRCSNMTWKSQVAHTLRALQSSTRSGIYVQCVRSPKWINWFLHRQSLLLGVTRNQNQLSELLFLLNGAEVKVLGPTALVVEDMANYISRLRLRVWQGTRVQASRGGCGGLELSRACSVGRSSPDVKPRGCCAHKSCLEYERMGGDGVAPFLHVCMSAAALTCSLSVPKSGRARRLMRCFSFLSLFHVSLLPSRGGRLGRWGAEDDRLVIYSAFHICLLVLPFPPLSSNHFPAVICSLSCLQETGA